MRTIGIIVAMDCEIQQLKNRIEIAEEKQICNTTFYTGTYKEKEVVFTTAGIGKVNAAITTMLMIEHFKPELIINTGIAGGYEKTLQPLDVVVATKVLYSDVDMTAPAAGCYPYGQLEGCPEYFVPSYEFSKEVENVVYGTILTGDQFVVDYSTVDLMVKTKFEKYDVVAFDMESGSISHVCDKNNTKFLIIRAISDIIGSTSPFDYATFSKTASNKVADIVLESVISNL